MACDAERSDDPDRKRPVLGKRNSTAPDAPVVVVLEVARITIVFCCRRRGGGDVSLPTLRPTAVNLNH